MNCYLGMFTNNILSVVQCMNGGNVFYHLWSTQYIPDCTECFHVLPTLSLHQRVSEFETKAESNDVRDCCPYGRVMM